MSSPRGSRRSASPTRGWLSTEPCGALKPAAAPRLALRSPRLPHLTRNPEARDPFIARRASPLHSLPAAQRPRAAPIPAPPAVNARSWILVDHFSGRVLAQNNADERAEPASLTKLMTAYVVFTALSEGRLKLTDRSPSASTPGVREGSRTFVQVGTQVPVDILLKGMIVQSGNDATIALAEHVGGTEAGVRADDERVRAAARHEVAATS